MALTADRNIHRRKSGQCLANMTGNKPKQQYMYITLSFHVDDTTY